MAEGSGSPSGPSLSRVAAPKVVARTVLIGIVLVTLALLLWSGRDVLFILFFGLLVGVFLSVFTDWLEDVGLPRLVALGLVLAAWLGLVIGFWVLLWPTISTQLSTVGRDLPAAAQQAGEWLQSQYQAVSGQVGETDADLQEEVREELGGQMGSILGGALPILNSALGALTGLFVVLVVGVYTAARPRLYRDGFLRLVPPTHRDRVNLALERSGHSLRRWMIGTLINMVVVALLVLAGLWLLGIPAAIALALIAGILEFVPIIGPVMASLPAIAVALTVSPTMALWVALLYVVIQQVEGDVITPIVMRGAARLPPALTVLFQTLMAVVFGFLGLLLAVPILAVVIVAVQTLYVEPMEAEG